MPEPQLSIIIPVLNEAEHLGACLDRLFASPLVKQNQTEIIVSDGGSSDATVRIAQSYTCKLLHSPCGRAMQMNRAARVANGKYLLFLHADSHLPDSFDSVKLLTGNWGFFRLRLDGKAFVYRIIESAINLRTRLTRVGGGDQGLFFKRGFFEELSGFPEIPLMEDIAICKLARRQYRPCIQESVILSSSRRWQQNGVIKTVLLMWLLRFAYWLGVDPHRLHRIYYPQRS